MKPCRVTLVLRRKHWKTLFHFLGKHNLPIKELYPALLHFLAFDLEEPITKQYLENCPKNATYDSHATANSLISALTEFYLKRNGHKIQKCFWCSNICWWSYKCCQKRDDGYILKLLQSGQPGICDGISTKSAVLLDKLVKILNEPETDHQKTRLFLLRWGKFNFGRNIRSSKKNSSHISP